VTGVKTGSSVKLIFTGTPLFPKSLFTAVGGGGGLDEFALLLLLLLFGGINAEGGAVEFVW
jgi:hypothetical protein